MRYLLSALFCASAFGQGWTQLPNTTFNSVAAPDNFSSTYMGHAMPANTFATDHYRILDQWGSAWIDTRRHRMCFYGGGHNGPNDNSIQCLDLVSLSSSTATCGGQSCITTSNSGAVPAMTRINDPSVFQTGCPQGANYDGTPQSMQNWGGLVYLPKADKYFSVSDADVCPDNLHQTWLYDPTQTGPTAWISGPSAPNNAGAGDECALDPTTVQESVTCIVQNTFLYRFTCTNAACTTSTWTALSSGAWTIRNGAGVVIDPDRRMLYSIGPNFNAVSPGFWEISLDSPYGATDLTSSVTGCADITGWPYASLVWDPSLHRVVGYAPQSASAQGTAANKIVIYDPATLTCTPQPQLGGSGPAASGHIIGSSGSPTWQGTEMHFALFPELGYYILVNNETLNAYKFTLNTTPTNGLGSSTLTCVDRDGDGYGTGSGCTGADADDLDSSVHTMGDACNKWNATTCGTPTNAQVLTVLQHLGYNPVNIWYVATTGNDGTGVANNPALPFATCCGTGHANPAAGDAVLWRGGTYTSVRVTLVTGTAGNPVLQMGYPGELPVFSAGTAAGFDLTESQTYDVMDGFRISGSGSSNACVGGGENTNIVMRHIETSACANWGIDLQGDPVGQSGCPSTNGCQPLNDITVEDSSMHDSAGQHGFYYSSHEDAISKNIFARRSLAYSNNWNGFHFTGQFSNANFTQLLTYSNGLSGYSWQNGTSNSVISDSVSLNDAQSMDIDLYDGSGTVCNGAAPYPIGTVCPYAQSNNLFTNLTFYLTGTHSDPGQGGLSNGHTYGVIFGRQASGCTITACTTQVMNGNTFQNIAIVTNNTDGGNFASGSTYPPFQFPDSTGVTFLPHTNFSNIDVLDLANSGIVVGYGPGASFGYSPLNCTTLGTTAMSSSACNNVDPKFVSASTSFWNSLASFDLHLASGSPAYHTGTNSLATGFDLYGNTLGVAAPSMGAIDPLGGQNPATGISGPIRISGPVSIH